MTEQKQTRVAVVTGASSGIGKAAATALAAQGWRVIGLGRDAERCAAAETEIRAQAAPGTQVEIIRADLSLLADTVRAANEIIACTNRVDVLLNNAGGVAKAQVITAEGNEATFASNHLGHFLLTNRLLPLLRQIQRRARRALSMFHRMPMNIARASTGTICNCLKNSTPVRRIVE